MKRVYIDTSVLLAKWIPTDLFHEESKKIVEAVKTERIRGIVSGLGLAEASSVVERQQGKFAPDLAPEISLSAEYLKRIVMIPHLEILDIVYPIQMVIAGSQLELSLIYWQSLDLAPKFHLKTLDNLHLAISVLSDKLKGRPIDYFVTGDHEIVSNAHQIKTECGFSSMFPDQLVTLEGL
ncbi:MAG: type II toxin-antitoxin system VapC family toxin [Promethearchaeota archaeon]